MRRPEFELFLIRNQISKTQLQEKSTVSRRTIRRWILGKVEPRGDSLELVLESLSEILERDISAEEAGLS